MPKLKLVIRWIGINGLFLGLSFLATGLMIWLFPAVMLNVFGKWATLLSSLGAKSATDLGSLSEIFWHIVQRNALAVGVFFLIGLVLQAPLGMIFEGAFYALIALLATETLGRSFNWNDWFLIVLEMSTLLLGASLSMALSGELYGVAPGLRSWWQYSKESWKSLAFEVPAGWRAGNSVGLVTPAACRAAPDDGHVVFGGLV